MFNFKFRLQQNTHKAKRINAKAGGKKAKPSDDEAVVLSTKIAKKARVGIKKEPDQEETQVKPSEPLAWAPLPAAPTVQPKLEDLFRKTFKPPAPSTGS
jgi:hypothetical protein